MFRSLLPPLSHRSIKGLQLRFNFKLLSGGSSNSIQYDTRISTSVFCCLPLPYNYKSTELRLYVYIYIASLPRKCNMERKPELLNFL